MARKKQQFYMGKSQTSIDKFRKRSTAKRISPTVRVYVDFSRLEDKDASINQYEIALFFFYVYKGQQPITTLETTANEYQAVVRYDLFKGRLQKLREKSNQVIFFHCIYATFNRFSA